MFFNFEIRSASSLCECVCVLSHLNSSSKSLSFLFRCGVMEVESTDMPNWLELPKDITMNILQRLDTLEIVTSACVVCPLWWNICKDSLMWHTIDMMSNISLCYSDYDYSSRLEKICRYAVDQSCGHLKDIYINKFGTGDLHHHIAIRYYR